MFGRQKMYKAGIADTMQSNAEFMQKQQAAIEHMRHEVSQGIQLGTAMQHALTELNGCYFGLSQYLNEKEKAALYNLHSSMDIKDFEKSEKHLLIAILYQLASDEGTFLTDYQKLYLRNIQKYLGISNPQTQADFTVISDIDSLDIQKACLECVLEFLYLQEGNEISDSQEACLEYFSVNKKYATLIEDRVAHIYKILGPEGLVDKYAFVLDVNIVDDEEYSEQDSAGSNETESEEKGAVEEDPVSDDVSVKTAQQSDSAPSEEISSIPAKNTGRKRVSKFYGVRPADAIKFAWADATFAVEKRVNAHHRKHVQHAAAEGRKLQAEIKAREDKLYAACNNQFDSVDNKEKS